MHDLLGGELPMFGGFVPPLLPTGQLTRSSPTRRAHFAEGLRAPLTQARGVPVCVARVQDVPPKSTFLVSTVPAVRPGAVW
jgi:hypothetical protein